MEAAAAIASLAALKAKEWDCAALARIFSRDKFSKDGDFFHVGPQDTEDGIGHSIKVYAGGAPFWPILLGYSSLAVVLEGLAAYNVRPRGAMDEVEAAKKG